MHKFNVYYVNAVADVYRRPDRADHSRRARQRGGGACEAFPDGPDSWGIYYSIF